MSTLFESLSGMGTIYGSIPSGPEINLYITSKSTTCLAIGPFCVKASLAPTSKEIKCPVLGTLPEVGFNPKIPQ